MKRETILRLLTAATAVAMTLSQADAATKTLLYAFKGGTDGGNPEFAMIQAPDGALYGVTSFGGGAEKGTVFKLTPPTTAGGAWKMGVIYRFTGGADGASPQQLYRAADGTLYGTTTYGGDATCKCGVVYKMSPPRPGKSGWSFRVLHTFVGGADGAWPKGALIAGANGALVGVTSGGGAVNSVPFNKGTIYKIWTAPAGQTSLVKVIWAFQGGTKGELPAAGVIRDSAGVLYGTTEYGGASTYGTSFSLTPPSTGMGDGADIAEAPWVLKVLHSFGNWDHGQDGAYPAGELIMNANGALFGVTSRGGLSSNQNGTVYRAVRTGGGTETVLYRFKDAATDGHVPKSGVVAGPNSTLWGTTSGGGDSNQRGIVYKLAYGAAGWAETVVYRFKGGADGEAPYAALTPAAGGGFYGTTRYGGANGRGTVFKLVP